MTSATPSPAPPAPRAWSDRWLLDLMVRDACPGADAAAAIEAPTAWEALEAAGVPPAEVAAAVTGACGCGYLSVGGLSAASAPLLDAALALRYAVVPVREEGSVLYVATANPREPRMEPELAFATGRAIGALATHPRELRGALDRLYGAADAAAERGAPLPVLRGDAEAMQERMLAGALEAGASDIHLEPHAAGVLVRIRVDGALEDSALVAPECAAPLLNRFKITAGLDIADRMRPQDGRSTTRAAGRRVDLRISTLPLESGKEKIVIRILDSGSTTVELADLGFLPSELHRLERLLQSRDGVVLVTGPTGSGKTTTLYSVLRRVQDDATNIITIEDPVEYRLDGVNQVQVNEKAGLTFASALRSMLRQDPDVILVGEIRDGETAGIGIKASLTGHLVLSTLHTNDAPSAVGRLADLGVDAGALAAALRGVVAQRLLRRLCTDCSQPVSLADLPVEQQALLAGRDTRGLRRSVGCARCRRTGYRGRMVVAEVLAVTPDLQRAIAQREEGPEITRLARAGGMATLWEAGIERVLAGTTSLHELLDNVAAPFEELGELSSGQGAVDALLAQLRGGSAPAPAPAQAAPPAPPRPVGRTSGAPGVRVLVADDDREARQALAAALRSEGLGVIEAADGAAALEYAGRLRPDWVVAEVALPRLDAAGLIQALAESAVPVVVYTAQRDEALLDWLRELGAADVLDRGMDPRLLAARLRAELREAA
jgi:type II secretory ATPase GspE/PulE/Tfp pilus assembly ATPase PilB-like protein/CheY-like chemotaxis protein